MEAAQIIALLALEPHPEGGFYRQTFQDSERDGGRAASTLIYFLLEAGQSSAWHRVDAAEVWHYYAGAPLRLVTVQNNMLKEQMLGIDFEAGQRPQAIVPAHVWQSAHSCGTWTLVGCTVAPGFQFSGFELASTNWQPLQVKPEI